MLQLLQQAVVQLAVGVHLALEQVELHTPFLARHNFVPCRCKPCTYQCILPLGHGQVVAHRNDGGIHFLLDLRVVLGHLFPQLLHFREVVFVHLGVFKVFGLQLGALLFVALYGFILKHLPCSVGCCANGLVFRLCFVKLLLGLGQRPGELGKRLVNHTGFFVQRQNIFGAGIFLQFAFAFFQFGLGGAQLPFQKVFGIAARVHAPLQVQRNKLLPQCVGNAGGQLWAGIFNRHLQHARVAHLLNHHRLLKGLQHLFAVQLVSIGGSRAAHFAIAVLYFAPRVFKHGRPARVPLLPGITICAGGLFSAQCVGIVVGQGHAVKLQLVHHAFGQHAAFQQLQVGTHGSAFVVALLVTAQCFVFVELHHLRSPLVHLQGGAGQVQRGAHKTHHQRGQQAKGGNAQQQTLVLHHQAPKVAQVQRTFFHFRAAALARVAGLPHGIRLAQGWCLMLGRASLVRHGQVVGVLFCAHAIVFSWCRLRNGMW